MLMDNRLRRTTKTEPAAIFNNAPYHSTNRSDLIKCQKPHIIFRTIGKGMSPVIACGLFDTLDTQDSRRLPDDAKVI